MISKGRKGGWKGWRRSWEEGELKNRRESRSDKKGDREKQVCWVLVPRTTQNRKSLAHFTSRLWVQVRPNPHSLISGVHTGSALSLGHLGHRLGPPTRERPPNFGVIINLFFWKNIFFGDIDFWDNYSKPTCGMTRFHFTYLWLKILYFVHLNFNPLSTSVKIMGKNVFYLHFYVSFL